MTTSEDLKARMVRPRIGLLPSGHLMYWDQFAGLRDMCLDMCEKVQDRLGHIGLGRRFHWLRRASAD